MAGPVNTWVNQDKHVDATITDVKDFLRSSNIVIYAKTAGEADTVFRPVGVIQGWTHSEQHQIEELFEIGSDIRYLVPGRATGQISITRMLMSAKDIANTLYNRSDIRSLKDVDGALDILFVAYSNKDSKSLYSKYFKNVQIAAKQESINANQVIVAENATFVYESISDFTIKE